MPHQALRSRLRHQRRNLLTETKQIAASRITNSLLQLPAIKNATHIGCYIAHDGEIDTTPFMMGLSPNQQLYLPVLRGEHDDRSLEFYRYAANEPLKPNRFGIPEPDLNQPSISIDQLEAVVTPLVAFDLQGNRLGRGAGYYDRTFAFKKTLARGTAPVLIGIGYAFQEITPLEINPWDIPMDLIVTEEKVLSFYL